jgi:hypothetical protein
VRGVKCGTFAVSQRWRGIKTHCDAVLLSAKARDVGGMARVVPVADDARV